MTDFANRGPLGLKKPKPEGKPRKRMKQVSDKRAAHWRSPEGKAELAYMEGIKGERCVICDAHPPSDAHHCCHDRYGSKKESGFDTIPLCKAHHQDGPEAIHNGKETWRRKHGPDHSYIKQTRETLREKGYKIWEK